MCDGVHDILEIHSCALNGRALDTLESWWGTRCICVRDGAVIGEGPRAVREALERAFQEDLVTRVMDMGSGPAIVAFDGVEGRGVPRVMVHLEGNGRVDTCRIQNLAS